MDPEKIKKWSEVVDSWRLFPRAFITVYMYLLLDAAMWYMGLPNPSGPQSAFLGTIVGAGAAWFGLYVNSGSSNK